MTTLSPRFRAEYQAPDDAARGIWWPYASTVTAEEANAEARRLKRSWRAIEIRVVPIDDLDFMR